MRRIIPLIIIIVIIFVYILFQDQLPPRTPYKIAKSISGLSIPSNCEIKDFRENWNENGDGELFIEIQLDHIQMTKVITEAAQLKYRPLPISEQLDGFVNKFLQHNPKGVYRISIDKDEPASFDLIVLDATNNRVIIYSVIT